MVDPLLPSTFWAILLSFESCFTRPSFANFVSLATGWIMCVGRHSVSRAIQAGRGVLREKHHSALYRFLSRADWATDSVGHALLDLFLPFLPPAVTVLVDDTLCRRNGPHVFGAGMHHDPLRSTYGAGLPKTRWVSFAFGLSWVVLAVWVPLPWNPERGLAVPILFRLYRAKKRCPKDGYRKRTQLASELLGILASWIPADHTLHAVGDAEYSCGTVIRALPAKTVFSGPIPMNAALFAEAPPRGGMGRPRLKGRRLPAPRSLAEDPSVPWKKLRCSLYGKRTSILVKSQVCLWYSVARTRLVKVIVTRDPKHRWSDRAFFCTDAARGAQHILCSFTSRWELEVAFRNAKQTMGLEQPQNGWWRRPSGTPAPPKRPGPQPHAYRGETAVRHTFPLAFTSYAIVIAWYFRHGRRDRDVARARSEAPWYRRKAEPSFSDMLAAVRREIWASRLSARRVTNRVRRNLRGLLPQWLLAA